MSIRRLAGIAALGAAAVSTLGIPSASAQEVTYSASADGQALGLSLFGQQLTAGKTHADISSAPKATATGDGIANPLAPAGQTSAEVTTDGKTDGSPDENCQGVLDQIPGLVIDLACSASQAQIADGAPAADSTARVGTLQLDPIDPLVATPLADVVDQAQGGVDQLLSGLAPVLQPVDDATNLGLQDTLGDLFTALFNGAPLATLNIGNTTASTEATADAVTSTCTASGGQLDILDPAPVGGIDAPPVISVVIGDASTSVVAKTDGSTPTATANPALVTVRVPSSPQLAEVTVAPGQSVDIPLPDPFGSSTISVAAGDTGTNDDGSTFARASGVRLDLLNGDALMGGIELSLADCASVVGADVPLPRDEPPAVPVTAPPALPRTGGTTPNGLALAATVGLAGLGLALLRRSRLD